MRTFYFFLIPLGIVGLTATLARVPAQRLHVSTEDQNPPSAPAHPPGPPPAVSPRPPSPGSAPTKPAHPPQTGPGLLEMEARFAAAVASKDREAFLSFWADDAAIFPPGGPVIVGKEKILENWNDILSNPEVSLAWSPDKVEVSASGDLGYTYGKYVWTGKGADGRTSVHNGKYVTIWKKQEDGQWRVVVDLGTPSDPPAPKANSAS